MHTRISDVLVIVPVHNEAESLGAVLNDLERHAPEYDVIVVNDGSTDGSAEIARCAGARVLEMPFNLGIGGAVQAGFRYALEHGYRVAAQMDGDGQHHAGQLERIVAPVLAGEYEMCIGSRFLDGSTDYPGSAARRFGTRFLSTFCGVITGLRITDATSGFRAYSLPALSYLANHYPSDYPEPEAIVLLRRRGLSIGEVSVSMGTRQGGRSSIRGPESVYYMIKVSLSLLLALFKQGPARRAT